MNDKIEKYLRDIRAVALLFAAITIVRELAVLVLRGRLI